MEIEGKKDKKKINKIMLISICAVILLFIGYTIYYIYADEGLNEPAPYPYGSLHQTSTNETWTLELIDINPEYDLPCVLDMQQSSISAT